MSTSITSAIRAFAGLAAAGTLLVSVANADLTGPGFAITASNANGASATIPIDGHWEGDHYVWQSAQPIEMWDGAEYLGTLNPMDENGQPTLSAVVYYEDPVVSLNFSVQAGPVATQFSIASGLLSFPAINGATAAASAGYSVTDFNGNGALLTGNAQGGGYLAQYNGFAGTQSGTTFAALIPAVAAGAFATQTLSQDFPPVGQLPIVPAVSDISTLVSFELSAFDLASGTTNFVVVPEPAGLVLLAVGAALLRRRG